MLANISRSGEAPTFDVNSFGLPASSTVSAQTATTYEIGTHGRRPDITWDLALYRAEIKNELQCLRTAPWSLCSAINADRTVHQGAEAGLGTTFLKSIFAKGDRFLLNAAYACNDFFVDGDDVYGNNKLSGVPQHYLRSKVAYKHPKGFYAAPNVEWMPQAFFADNANSVTIHRYALLNFRITYGRGTGWSGYLEGRNLLDIRHHLVPDHRRSRRCHIGSLQPWLRPRHLRWHTVYVVRERHSEGKKPSRRNTIHLGAYVAG